MKNVVIACGGTGGHLTPGIALSQALEEKGYPTWLFTSQKEVDSRLASKYGKISFVSMHKPDVSGCPGCYESNRLPPGFGLPNHYRPIFSNRSTEHRTLCPNLLSHPPTHPRY